MSSSKYCTEAQTDRTTFEWTIKNFSLLLQKKGTPISSPFFYSKGNKEKWKLRFFPRGEEGSSEDYVSLFLHFASGKLPVTIQYELSIIQLPYIIPKRTSIHTLVTMLDSQIGNGYPDFAERSDLLGCVNDSFTIRCKIDKPLRNIITTLSDPPMAMTQEMSVDKTTGRLSKSFADLLENSKFSDVTIFVEEEKFLAHKVILAARSSVFAAMFDNKDMVENKKNEIKIERMEPTVVKGMLEFIYTDKVSNFDEISNGLLSAADKYDLVLLRALCEERLAKTLSNETAVEILVLADLHHSHHLKKHVMHFIDNHLADIIDSEGYKKMEEMYPELLKELFRFIALQKKTKKS